jgi:hypothetical protein
MTESWRYSPVFDWRIATCLDCGSTCVDSCGCSCPIGNGTFAWNLRDTGIRARASNKARLRLSLLPLAILSTT